MTLLENTKQFVKEKLQNAEAGHDWFHTERVYKNAVKIAASENCNLLVVEISALLHVIADAKFHDGDETLALKIADEFLTSQNCSRNWIDEVLYIIQNKY